MGHSPDTTQIRPVRHTLAVLLCIFIVSMAPAEGNQIISQCSYIYHPGVYDLQANLSGNYTWGATTCLVLGASDIVLNGNGYMIYSANTTSITKDALAIQYYWLENVTVRNLTIKDTTNGIVLWDGHNCTIEDIVIQSTKGVGISLINSTHNTIRHTAAINNTWPGYSLTNSSYNTFVDNVATYNWQGFDIVDSSNNNTISGNTINLSKMYGIYLSGSKGNAIYNNHLDNQNNIWIGEPENVNSYNISLTNGQNIIGGPNLGGNCWATCLGDPGFSQTCPDGDGNGICDNPYIIAGDNIDQYPLKGGGNTTPPLISNFTSNVTTGVAPLTVQFYDTSQGDPTLWLWYFCNMSSCTTSSLQNPIVTFSNVGNYSVDLNVEHYSLYDYTGKQDYIRVMAPTSLIPLPGYSVPPTDPDSDGLYEDVNGNERKDFADVVLFFEYMEWIAGNEPYFAFDFNQNGRIDFADIVMLFEEV